MVRRRQGGDLLPGTAHTPAHASLPLSRAPCCTLRPQRRFYNEPTRRHAPRVAGSEQSHARMRCDITAAAGVTYLVPAALRHRDGAATAGLTMDVRQGAHCATGGARCRDEVGHSRRRGPPTPPKSDSDSDSDSDSEPEAEAEAKSANSRQPLRRAQLFANQSVAINLIHPPRAQVSCLRDESSDGSVSSGLIDSDQLPRQ